MQEGELGGLPDVFSLYKAKGPRLKFLYKNLHSTLKMTHLMVCNLYLSKLILCACLSVCLYTYLPTYLPTYLHDQTTSFSLFW